MEGSLYANLFILHMQGFIYLTKHIHPTSIVTLFNI